jgi:copper transport protein
MKRSVVASLFALAFLALSCANALAHAWLVESRPADGDLLKQQPAQVELLFNEAVEIATASHVDPQGAVGRLPLADGRNTRVVLPLPQGLSQGSHLVSWRAISQDGHSVSGSLVFSIGQASGGNNARAQEPTINLSPLSAPLVAARFLLLAGLVFGVGAAMFAAFLAPIGAYRAVALSALGAGAFAALLSIGLQGADAHGQPFAALNDRAIWRSGLRLPQGVGALIALAAVALGGLAIFLKRRAARAVALFALALSALSLAWAGHARLWRPETLMQAVVILHVISAICWAGALLPLLRASQRDDFAPALRRFSAIAAPVYGLLLGSGVALAATQFLGPREVFETAWGAALAGKLILVAVVTLFAILNRTLFTKHALAGDAEALQLLRRSIRFEAALALAILAAASVWRLTPPPTSLGPANERAFQIHIHGTQAMASMTIRPARVGPVHMRIEPKSADLSPLRVKEVEVLLAPDAPGVEALRRAARLLPGSDTWVVEGLTIPAPGKWRISVDLLIDDFERARLDAVISLQP